MVKKILKILVLLILSLPLVYFGVYHIQNQTLKASYVSYNEGQGGDSFIRCDLNIFEPEFTDVYFTGDEGNISFKKTKMFFQTDEEWRQSRTGGTTIKNTTFPELVKMVKEDCDQFKQAKGEYHDKTMNWSYSKAPSQEEKNADIAESFKFYLSRNYTYEGLELFSEVYGDPFGMTDEEVVTLKERIDKEGVDERVYIVDRIAAFRDGYPELTDRQKQIILDTYGEWEHLSDKELADYSAKITEDSANGKLILE